jgi:hypothetical protein
LNTALNPTPEFILGTTRKRTFTNPKTRYRGLKKNHEWLCAAFAAINVYHHRKRLARINQRLAPQGA